MMISAPHHFDYQPFSEELQEMADVYRRLKSKDDCDIHKSVPELSGNSLCGEKLTDKN